MDKSCRTHLQYSLIRDQRMCRLLPAKLSPSLAAFPVDKRHQIEVQILPGDFEKAVTLSARGEDSEARRSRSREQSEAVGRSPLSVAALAQTAAHRLTSVDD